MISPKVRELNFDIDRYLNRVIPRSQLYRLPKQISFLLGHRTSVRQEVGNVLVSIWALVGAFCGLTVVSSVFRYSSVIQEHNPPVLVASLGAAAILHYNVIQSPLAQPRNAVLGNTLSAIVGVGITKLFMLSPNFENIRWLAGPLCCGLASWMMTMTNTIYPPGGATAVLAATDPTANAMGWFFVPLVLIGTLLMLGVALIINNIQRQYPLYWWTPRDVGRQKKPDIEHSSIDKEKETKTRLGEKDGVNMQHRIIITEDNIVLPENFTLGSEEEQLLEELRDRLRNADPQYKLHNHSSVSDTYQTPHSSRDILPTDKS
ncbi:uncharacterized protein K452DRAFT_269719 [Aplosporella prunicola CBS 121167]|uniref:HPP transmembrane region domain-containing protein n=1 Tax=Aplosporella prunicola CBS 121167 TaxID=1176127 RepID=A0A6A6BI71_9PEZI|nr:uncharacterized protein K452DRAFT_269719 [Aplosporella prunicola CBS 121167]KAF2143035.1 hypothetical protein K452DRAFT_269719 [Aplosporella prunicola CBS 121167]